MKTYNPASINNNQKCSEARAPQAGLGVQRSIHDDESYSEIFKAEGAFAIAISPSGAVAYVTGQNSISGTVTVIDTATNTITTTFSLGVRPGGMAITPNGAFLYVTDSSGSGNGVTVINTANNAVATTIPVGSSRAVAITPNGAFAYVDLVAAPISVISTANNTQVTTVNVGANAASAFAGTPAVDPTGTSVYVPVGGFSPHVSVISTATNLEVTSFFTGNGPAAVAFAVNTHGPTNKDQCKNSDWQTFTNPSFKNQGQCIKFVNHMNEHDH